MYFSYVCAGHTRIVGTFRKKEPDMLRLIALIAYLAAISTSSAATFPSRPITLIVPVSAGGPTDVIARTLAERMHASLGQPVIIENVTGGAGNIGVGRLARSAPDGYTIG